MMHPVSLTLVLRGLLGPQSAAGAALQGMGTCSDWPESSHPRPFVHFVESHFTGLTLDSMLYAVNTKNAAY